MARRSTSRVLRYRAMVCGVAAPGLALRPYFNRYTEDAIDLCDVLASFSPQNKASLHELCRVMGLPGKPDGISGADVEKYVREGRIAEVAAYCETDVVNTYPGLAALRAVSRTADRERPSCERGQSERLHTVPQQHQAPSRRCSRPTDSGVIGDNAGLSFIRTLMAHIFGRMNPPMLF